MKAIQDAITVGTIPPKTDREILAEVTRSINRAHIAGVSRNLAGTGNLDSGRSQPDPGYCTREQLEYLKRQHALEKEEKRKAFESQQNALKIFVDFFNREQGTFSSQFHIPDLYTPQVFPCSISTPGGPSSTSPSPSSTPLGLVTMVIVSMMSIFMMTSRDYAPLATAKNVAKSVFVVTKKWQQPMLRGGFSDDAVVAKHYLRPDKTTNGTKRVARTGPTKLCFNKLAPSVGPRINYASCS
nr:hypothetical protein [Tanacetum cinerariifolium]